MSEIDWDFYFKAATAFKDIVTPVGIVCGGLWAYFRFILVRDKETALDINLNYTTLDYQPGAWIVFADIVLKNKGKVRLRVQDQEPAYDHKQGLEHRYNYGLGLKICRIPDNLCTGSWIDWFDDSQLKETLPEVNLLKGYVKPAGDTLQTDFWMEPGETYSLAVPLILAAGSYLAMVTFVGASRKIDEFWQRSFLIQVPLPKDDNFTHLPPTSRDTD